MRVELELNTDKGQLQATLLRPREWVEANGVQVGRELKLELAELNVVGLGRATSIGRGEVSPGRGCVVTGTLVHTSERLVTIQFEGEESLTATSNHRLYSSTRRDWVAAGELGRGEYLRTVSGATRVADISVVGSAPTAVFNIEVSGTHRYFVGSNSILAHNYYTGFAPGTGASAFPANRLQHASRHLISAGLLPNWNKNTATAFRQLGASILENPTATFNHTLRGGQRAKGFLGEVSGTKVVFLVFAGGPRSGQVATAIVPSAAQLTNWGLL